MPTRKPTSNRGGKTLASKSLSAPAQKPRSAASIAKASAPKRRGRAIAPGIDQIRTEIVKLAETHEPSIPSSGRATGVESKRRRVFPTLSPAQFKEWQAQVRPRLQQLADSIEKDLGTAGARPGDGYHVFCDTDSAG